MTEGAYVRDVHSLEKLNNMLAFTGEAMANIEENVSNYLDGVKKVLDKQLELIEKKIEEAQERLRRAEKSLSRCRSMQRYDEESGERRPSCNMEARAVETAKQEIEQWKKKYDKGKTIVGECKCELDDYNYPGSPLSPPGGHYLILNMCENQTPKATQQLQDFIEEIYEYKQQDVGGDPSAITESTNPAVRDEDKPMDEDEKYAAFKKNIQGIKDEQEIDSSHFKIKDANRAMRCPNCGMPLQVCTCKNLHVNVKLYQ